MTEKQRNAILADLEEIEEASHRVARDLPGPVAWDEHSVIQAVNDARDWLANEESEGQR